MDGVLGLLLVGSVFTAVLAGLVLLARRIRRRNLHGGLLSVAEEIYLPSAPRLRGETQQVRLAERKSGEKP
ncbi:hypothetical protein ABT369_55015 [Dactylosporangium sp. NPDC000244]|uniref:hypothetical protein n=1 Tax=Dactylosporangium sp. NPDC000244 TaxID=3154365 RepID=UPI00331EC159